MKIGVMSDSHDDVALISSAVEVFNRQDVSLVFHAGDIHSYKAIGGFQCLRARFIGICGNNDDEWLDLRDAFASLGQVYKGYYDVHLEGIRIALIHELYWLHRLPPNKQFDLVIYGHTHHFDVKEGKFLLLNPGQCSHWVDGEATVAILDSETLEITKYILDGDGEHTIKPVE